MSDNETTARSEMESSIQRAVQKVPASSPKRIVDNETRVDEESLPNTGHSAKKVYPTLKVNIQHFLSTKIIENIQISTFITVILMITSCFH